MTTWIKATEKIVDRCEIAEKFNLNVVLLPDAAGALGKIVKEMAEKLDSAMKFLEEEKNDPASQG